MPFWYNLKIFRSADVAAKKYVFTTVCKHFVNLIILMYHIIVTLYDKSFLGTFQRFLCYRCSVFIFGRGLLRNIGCKSSIVSPGLFWTVPFLWGLKVLAASVQQLQKPSVDRMLWLLRGLLERMPSATLVPNMTFEASSDARFVFFYYLLLFNLYLTFLEVFQIWSLKNFWKDYAVVCLFKTIFEVNQVS